MKAAILPLIIIAALFALPGCGQRDNASAVAVTATPERPADTGGSESGDFGPPQGAPVHAVLTSPPNVPAATGRTAPAKVIVELEVREVEKEISEGVTYTFWTFGGTVPGSFIRVRQGDTVEFHLKNHQDSKMPHNIDLHGVTGPGGGAASSFTAPGHESQFTFKALNAGLFVYHCATAPVGMHIGNGMYGLLASVSEATAAAAGGTLTLEQQVKAGGALFNGTCSTCHQADGKGLPGVFPPLAKSDYLAADPKQAISFVTHGLTGKVTVNGQEYNSVMPPMTQLNDDEVANILTFVLNSWGNPGGQTHAEDVAKARTAGTR